VICAEVKIGGAMLLAQADCAPVGVRDVVALLALALVVSVVLWAMQGAEERG
jgi:hypothetical protein